MKYLIQMEFIPGNDQIWVSQLESTDPIYEYDNEQEALDNNCWPVAENNGGTARKMGGGGLTGDIGMNAEQEAALVAYLKTLSDIPTPRAPKPFDLESFHEGKLE